MYRILDLSNPGVLVPASSRCQTAGFAFTQPASPTASCTGRRKSCELPLQNSEPFFELRYTHTGERPVLQGIERVERLFFSGNEASSGRRSLSKVRCFLDRNGLGGNTPNITRRE